MAPPQVLLQNEPADAIPSIRSIASIPTDANLFIVLFFMDCCEFFSSLKPIQDVWVYAKVYPVPSVSIPAGRAYISKQYSLYIEYILDEYMYFVQYKNTSLNFV